MTGILTVLPPFPGPIVRHFWYGPHGSLLRDSHLFLKFRVTSGGGLYHAAEVPWSLKADYFRSLHARANELWERVGVRQDGRRRYSPLCCTSCLVTGEWSCGVCPHPVVVGIIGLSFVDGCDDCLGCSSPDGVCGFSQCLTLAWRLRRDSSWLLQAGVEATPAPPMEFDPEGRVARGRLRSRPGAARVRHRTRSPARQRRRLEGDEQPGEAAFLKRLGPNCKLASHFAFSFPAPLASAKEPPIRPVVVVDLDLEDDDQGGEGEDVGGRAGGDVGAGAGGGGDIEVLV